MNRPGVWIMIFCGLLAAGLYLMSRTLDTVLPREKLKAKKPHPAQSAPSMGQTPAPAAPVPAPPGPDALAPLKAAIAQGNPAEITRLAGSFSGEELTRALDLVKRARRWQIRLAFYAGWARRDPDAAARWALATLPPGGDRSYILHAAAAAWSNPSITFADWLRNVVGVELADPSLQRPVAPSSGGRPSLAAAAPKDRRPPVAPPGSGALTLDLLLAAWSAEQPDAAAAWAAQLPEGPAKAVAVSTIAVALASTRPGLATSLAESLEAGAGKEATLAEVARQSGGAAAGTAAASLLPSEALVTNTTLAAELATQIPDEAGRGQAVRSDALQTIAVDPKAAVDLVLKELPEGREQTTILREVVWSWTTLDENGALAWAQALTNEAKQATSMATVAMAAARTNAAHAADLALTIPNATTRSNTIANVAYQWALVDADAATSWADALPEDQGRAAAQAACRSATGR